MHGYGHGGARISWVGVFLVIMGAWWLLDEMGFAVHFEWRYIGPLALVLVGLSLLVGRCRWGRYQRETGPFVDPPRPPQ